MKKAKYLLTKGILSAITHIAFLFILMNISTTCCGPGYQPVIPNEAYKFRRNHKNEENC